MIDACDPICVCQADEAVLAHKAAATVMGTRDIITVVRDPRHTLGKQFSFAEDGVVGCARLRAHSSSARVSVAGVPVGGGNGHTWVQLANAIDVLRLRSVVKARAMAMDMTWKKPKCSRTTGEVVGNDVVSIIDWSVFTPGRLVFVGKPVLQDV